MDTNPISKVRHSVQVLTTMLMDILRDRTNRQDSVAKFQKEVWKLDAPSDDFPELRILRDLALHLDYYRPDPLPPGSDSSRYGDQRLEAEIAVAIRKLSEPTRI